MTARRLMFALAMAVTPAVCLAQDPPTVGAFTVMASKDPMSDEDRSGIFATSDGNTIFGFRCLSDGLNVVFGFGKYFMGDNDRVPVIYRFPPAEAAKVQQWPISTNNQNSFMPMGTVKEFTKEALTSQTVVFRATDRDGDQVTAQFKLDGLADALKRLSCYKP